MENNYTIFDDYKAWKEEKAYLLDKLVKSNSKMILRFLEAIIVVDYFYDRNKKKKLNSEEYNIFSTGFDYIFNQFETIEGLLKDYYNNDFELMNKYSQTINLLLYVDDIITEFLNNDLDITKLTDLKSTLFSYIESKSEAPDEYFRMLDDILYEQDIELNTIDQIFYEIALELNLINDNLNDNFDIYSKAIEEKLNNTKKEDN